MAETLRSLAGDAFRATDVISGFHAPLTPEQVVLERYVFLPHARTGIAAALSAPFDWGAPARGSITIRVPVHDERGSVDAEMTVNLHGPADVVEIDPSQVIRTLPRPDVHDAEIEDLVHVEFDRPDFPWLFTPTGPDVAGHLVPWISLVVAERERITVLDRRGSTSRVRIRRDQLQPLDDAWAWAHAQVMGAKAADPKAEPTLDQRLGEGNAAHNLSRLLCPRRLDERRTYVACVVPTFLVGRQAGLGLEPTTDRLTPAWSPADDPLAPIELPAYVLWQFTTAQHGNFESLAHDIRPAVAPPGVGRRRVEATRPWPDAGVAADGPGAEIVVEGPVVSPQEPPEGEWPSEADQHWPADVTAELVERLNRADVQAHEPDPGPPLVGPPLYGGNHAQQPRIDGDEPDWFAELNTDPRHRIVGGLGTRVVQMDQEDLMVSAWNQVGGVEAANRALRLAQLAKHVNGSLHRRHLARFGDGALLSVTERVLPKLHDAPDRTIWAAIAASSLPPTTTAGGFRRLTRPRGPVTRAAIRDRADRGAAVGALTVPADRYTRDWVHVSNGPDGIRRVGEAAQRLLTDAIAKQVAPGLDREALVASWQAALPRPAGSDVLLDDALAGIDRTSSLDLRRELATNLLERVLTTMPTAADIERDIDAAHGAALHALMLQQLAGIAAENGYPLPLRVVKRFELEGRRDQDRRDRMWVDAAALSGLAERTLDVARQYDGELPFDEFEQSLSQLREFVIGRSEIGGGRLREGLAELASRVVRDDPFIDAPRGRLDAPALALVAKLDPATTVPARVRGRLTAGTGRLPGWLRPDWFDDGRIEPVMACPRFDVPMYEALHRYDRDWMIPGLGLIERPDMATLLQTNNRFVEAFLVGLNHEMGRELLWREYPTDQRGTYFRSFWTGQPELVADLHEAPWRTGALRTHVDAALDGQLVFLVRAELIRRYPGAVAHAARQVSLDEHGIPLFEATSPARTLFHILLAPNVLLAGFSLTKARIGNPGETWWFTLSENPTEPRFGLDAAADPEGVGRDNLAWPQFGVPVGGFLSAAPLGISFDGSTWGDSSASNAYLLFQLPARAAFSAAKMVAGATL